MPTNTPDVTLPNPISNQFWVRSEAEIDADLAELRARPPSFLPPVTDGDAADVDPEMMAALLGAGAWVLTRHSDIIDVSKNPSVFSSASGMTMLDTPAEFNEFFGSMISMDDPRHARLRKVVSAGFTPRMLDKLTDGVSAQAQLIIDEIADRGECDFVVDVAARLPLKIVCDLMGIPDSQLDFVFDQSNHVLGVSDPEYRSDDEDPLTQIFMAGAALSELMTDLAESKKGKDSDDLTTILVNAEVDGEQLTHAEIASFFILLVVAGNETTRNAIGWGLHYLTNNPDQRQIWMDDPAGVTATAVEEIVRLASPVTYMRRTALVDTEVGGVPIAEGDKLLQFYLAANRDESVFDDPLRFDVLRDPNPHVGFGGPGPHFCLGAHLARREIGVMFNALFERLGDIEAAGPPDLLASSFIHGVKHMPATFTPSG
ncbi:MAG: cytochrome P450 [Acidobacteria bacterium]|nr:cytochrome P450 [Acidobacteriota bacterium]